MDMEVAVNRVLRDMKMSGLISEDANGEVKVFLSALWVAGHENGIHKMAVRKNKPVVLYNIEGKVLGEYESIVEAAKANGCDHLTIERALKSGKETRTRHIWKFAERDAHTL
jgi:hypothetical protein